MKNTLTISTNEIKKIATLLSFDYEDTAFIIRAVNSHEALLEAAKSGLAFVENYTSEGAKWTANKLKEAITQAEAKQ
jgi:hypothetical protein